MLLLKVGAAAMSLALLLALATAVGVMVLRDGPEGKLVVAEPVAAGTTAGRESEDDPAADGDAGEEPGEEGAPAEEARGGDPRPAAASERGSPSEPGQGPGEEGAPAEEAHGGEPEPESRRAAAAAALPGEGEGWTRPSNEELKAIDEPRRFAPDPNAALTLTVPALGVYDAPVLDSDAPWALASGVVHVPETSMPWDGGAQRNVYLAAHRLGLPDAASRLLFYNLDDLGSGDEVMLKGRGQTYRYRVSETFEVGPADSWVMGQVRGRDMVSLQTCTPIPTFEKRLVVRADRV
jgi:sortase A